MLKAAAVSYTHLDVYKRQPHPGTAVLRADLRLALPAADSRLRRRAQGPRGRAHRPDGKHLFPRDPVSYTHLDVYKRQVPMRMGDEQREIQRASLEFLHEGLAEQPESGAGVKDDDVATGTDFHAGRVAAVAHRSRSRRGNRAANTPEFYARAGFDVGNLAQVRGKIKLKLKNVGWERLELSTNALKGHCSTD